MRCVDVEWFIRSWKRTYLPQDHACCLSLLVRVRELVQVLILVQVLVPVLVPVLTPALVLVLMLVLVALVLALVLALAPVIVLGGAGLFDDRRCIESLQMSQQLIRSIIFMPRVLARLTFSNFQIFSNRL